MKMGMRKPSLKKSIKARTTGKIKRQVKKAVNPLYGKKGMGMINDPKKAIYNKVYHDTTFGVSDLTSGGAEPEGTPQERTTGSKTSPATWKTCGIIMKVFAVVVAVLLGLPGLFAGLYALLAVAAVAAFGLWMLGTAWSKKGNIK